MNIQGPDSEFAENSRIYGLAMAAGYLVQARRGEVERWWTIARRYEEVGPEFTRVSRSGRGLAAPCGASDASSRWTAAALSHLVKRGWEWSRIKREPGGGGREQWRGVFAMMVSGTQKI